MNGDEVTGLPDGITDDMPEVGRPEVGRPEVGRPGVVETLDAASRDAVARARRATRRDEDVRAAVRRIGVER